MSENETDLSTLGSDTKPEEKKIEQKYDNPIEQEYYERAVKHAQFIDSKRQSDYKYYGEKLTKMCEDTMSVITPETTPEELAQLLKIGNKEYLAMIARARQTKKYLKLNLNAYMQCMIDGLQRRMILTNKKTIEEGIVTEDVSKELSDQEQNEIDMLSAANSVDMGDLHKEVEYEVKDGDLQGSSLDQMLTEQYGEKGTPERNEAEARIDDISKNMAENNILKEESEGE